MAKPSRQGRQITVGTYKAGTNLSLTAVGTLLKKGVLGVVPVSAATDDAIGSLHQRVLGSDAGVDIPQTHPTPVSYTHMTLPTICSV